MQEEARLIEQLIRRTNFAHHRALYAAPTAVVAFCATWLVIDDHGQASGG